MQILTSFLQIECPRCYCISKLPDIIIKLRNTAALDKKSFRLLYSLNGWQFSPKKQRRLFALASVSILMSTDSLTHQTECTFWPEEANPVEIFSTSSFVFQCTVIWWKMFAKLLHTGNRTYSSQNRWNFLDIFDRFLKYPWLNLFFFYKSA